MRRIVWILTPILLAACTGDAGVDQKVPVVTTETPDSGEADSQDTGEQSEWPDARDDSDGTASPACEGIHCGTNAHCEAGICVCDTGHEGDPATECTPLDSCAGVDCGLGARCVEGMCQCDPYFVEHPDGGCVPESPGDTALRSRAEVCERFRADHPRQATQQWATQPASTCEPGVLHDDVVQDAVRRTNLYRWLVGLEPVTTDPGYAQKVQECATTLAAQNDGLTHDIPQSYACYTSGAAEAASKSNLSWGRSNPADSIDDGYIRDANTPSLGHRRWIFNPSFGKTAFGQRDGYSCMWVLDFQGGGAEPEFVAYPAPGYFPRGAMFGVWSFSTTKYEVSEETTVSIIRADDGAEVAVRDPYVPDPRFGPSTFAWTVENAELDTTYEVTVGNVEGRDFTYFVTLVDCS